MNRSTQHGVTLISLLIGLVISMIAVLGVTTLFRTVLKNNTEASVSAQTTAERASAFLITDMHLHDAGYGMDGLANNNILLLKGASLEGTPEDKTLSATESLFPSSWPVEPVEEVEEVEEGNALIWRYKEELDDTASSSCAGLWLGTDAQDNNLIYYLIKHNCTTLSNNTSGWTAQLLLKAPTLPEFPPTNFSFIPTQGSCRGFGIAGEGGLQVTLQIEHNLGRDLEPILLKSSTCLLNFSPPESI